MSVPRPSANPLPGIAIIGIGCLFPKAGSPGAYWANIKQGTDAITEVPPTHWRPEEYFDGDPKRPDFTYGHRGGFLSVEEFNPMDYGMLPSAIEATDTSQLLGMVAAERALEDAGLGKDVVFDREKVSVILGVTGALELVIPLGARLGHPIWRKSLKDAGVDDATAEDVVNRISRSYVPWQENSFPGLLGNVVAGRITKHLGLGGTNCVVDAACASSLGAVDMAMLELQAGKADVVVTGGVDTFNDIFMFMCFSKTPALSPSGDSKPFDANGDGTILGEGLGMIVLKRLDEAERDGNRIYAVLRGVGSSSDGKGDAIYAPSAKGQAKALRRAYEAAGVDPHTVELIEAHGTGTRAGDAAEVSGLVEAFGDAQGKPWCALGSVKSQIGHTKAAAGAAGLIKAALALYNKTLPPTIKVKQPLDILCEASSPFYVNTDKRPWLPSATHPRRAGVSAMGFGGSNFHCVLEEYQGQKTQADWDGTLEILALSAQDKATLRRTVEAFQPATDWNGRALQAAQSRSGFDATAPCRLLVVFEESDDLAQRLRDAAAALGREEGGWNTPHGVFYGEGIQSGSLAFVFPGQGAQYPGMLRDLACQFPDFLNTLDTANHAVLKEDSAAERVSDQIYPRPAFDAETKRTQEAVLQATQNAQPAIGAVSVGALKVLAHFGIRPEAVAGHSYGELVALHAAGRVTEEELFRISRVRGTLMARGSGDKGAMMAVRAPLETVEAVLAEEKLDVIVANKNAPDQAVLSGSTEAIALAEALFARHRITAKKLPVAAAFHSRWVADAEKPFLKALESIDFTASSLPAYSNTTASRYPEDPTEARALLAAQLANPVEFVREIEAMYAAGVRTFVEAGPGARMTGLVQSILKGRDAHALALDSSSGKRGGLVDLARTLAQLAALGHAPALEKWNEGVLRRTASTTGKARIAVPLSGANHFQPKPIPPSPTKVKVTPAQPATTEAHPAQNVQMPAQAAPAEWSEALRMTQQNLAALQQLQEQTAQLHTQFLQGQQQAVQTLHSLLEQQRSTFSGGVAPVAQSQPIPRAVEPPRAAQPQVVAKEIARPVAPPAAAAPNAAERILLETIAAKTGYPVEMLELDMSLDGDLGIDSIKRVEILSAVRDALPDAPEIGPEQLGQLHTLRDIVGHLSSGAPAISAAPAASTSAAQSILLETIAAKTGYPVEMLELDMSLDGDLGIDSIKRVEILSAVREALPDAPEIGPERLGQLRTLRDIVGHLSSGAPVAVASPAPSNSAAEHILLQTIAEKTGYPVDMLELDMSLDGDLGIDSIKRVEILSAVRESLPDAPEIGPEQLGQLHTLRDIVGYLSSGASSATAPVAPPPSNRVDEIQRVLIEVIAEKTGYPVDMLEPGMTLDADLGIDSIKRVEILSTVRERLPEAPEIGPEQLGQLHTPAQIVAFLAGGLASATPAAAPVAKPAAVLASDEAPLFGQVLRTIPLSADASTVSLSKQAPWLIASPASNAPDFAEELCNALVARGYAATRIPMTAHDTPRPETVGGLLIVGPDATTKDEFLSDAFRIAQWARPGLRKTAQSCFVTVSRMDGCFGLGVSADFDPLQGGLAGLSKTAQHEWPEVRCRALDVARGVSTEMVADELALDGPVETGLSKNGRMGLALAFDSPASAEGAPLLRAGDVVIVTGGARGVTAEVAVALAKTYQPVLALIGRSHAPKAEPSWLTSLQSEADIKRGLMEHEGAGATPKSIGESCRRILAEREVARNIERMRTAGAQVHYYSADLRDAEALRTVLSAIRTDLGPVRGLVHGAGVLADRLIEDKTIEQFAAVYETKVCGLRAVLEAADPGDLHLIALFSSSTGRFGRRGQADYAMANEVLNKMAQRESRLREGCKTVSINWGPWEGGMVTPALKKLFADEGIGVIGLETGSAYLVSEIASPKSRAVEIVAIAGQIPSATDTPQSTPGSGDMETAFELPLDVEAFPVLKSHVIKGHAVVPAALIMEWMAQAAVQLNPGLRFHGLDSFQVCKGIRLLSGETHTVVVRVAKAEEQGGLYLVHAELRGNEGDILHGNATVVLAHELPAGQAALSASPLPGAFFDHGEIYEEGYLFHGPALQSLSGVEEGPGDYIAATIAAAPAPAQWIAKPLRGAWLSDPLALDTCFQMMSLYSRHRHGASSLPSNLRSYRQFARRFPQGGVRIVAQVGDQNKRHAVATIEFFDPKSGALVARIDGFECTAATSLNEAFRDNLLLESSVAKTGGR